MISTLLLKKLAITSVIATGCIGYVVIQTQTTTTPDTHVSNELSMENFSPNSTTGDNEDDTSLLGIGGSFEMGRVGR